MVSARCSSRPFLVLSSPDSKRNQPMHIAIRTPLSRRTFLRAAGATLALPFLESMMPQLGHAAAAPEPPRRFVGLMTNMGILPDFFFPKKEGRDYDLPYYLELMK